MTDLIESKRDAIAEACSRHAVSRLDIFGSALRDDFLPSESDVDLLVEFAVDDEIVWSIIEHDVPVLRSECTGILQANS